MNRRTLLWGLLSVVGFTILIQFVPVPGLGKDPPVVSEPSWDSATTRTLAEHACFDCHSNQTRWPWYGRIAPFSWVVAHHVSEGRALLDFSDPARSRVTASRVAHAVTSRTMPPVYYSLVHPDARLSSRQRLALAQGLLASLRTTGGREVVPPTGNRAAAPDDLAPLHGPVTSLAADAGARLGPGPTPVTGPSATATRTAP